MIAIALIEQQQGPEMAAIVLACRVFLHTATQAELAAFFEAHTLNWLLFYQLAKVHHIRPVINKAIAGITTEEATAAHLQADCRNIAIRNFEHYKELVKLTALFEAAGVTTVPYKGSIYNLQFYGDLSLRESSDLDFLMHPSIKDLQAIEQIFDGLGYTNTSEVPAEFKAFYFSRVREFKFSLFHGTDRKYLAEFHSLLNDPALEAAAPVTNEYLFSDLQSQNLNGHPIKALTPTTHIIAIISHHGIREQWTSLKNLMDVAMAIKSRDKIDWNEVVACSNKHHFNKVLGVGFDIISDVLGIAPPVGIANTTNTARWLNALLTRHLRPADRTWRYNFSLKLRSKDSTADKAAMLWKHATYALQPTILDYRFIKLPKALFFLYIFIRPIRKMSRKKSCCE